MEMQRNRNMATNKNRVLVSGGRDFSSRKLLFFVSVRRTAWRRNRVRETVSAIGCLGRWSGSSTATPTTSLRLPAVGRATRHGTPPAATAVALTPTHFGRLALAVIAVRTQLEEAKE